MSGKLGDILMGMENLILLNRDEFNLSFCNMLNQHFQFSLAVEF